MKLVIIGAGPSGLAAAYEAQKHGADVTIIEKQSQVGGLAKTIAFNDCLFDIGPHRFFTKNQEVQELFTSVLGEDLVKVPRQTRIFYNNKYFDYPLSPFNAFAGLGLFRSIAIIASYSKARLQRIFFPRPASSFEEWIIDNFGRRLYETFFKTYTEKVWGIPCTKISAEWAAQRIKNLSLRSVITNMFFKSAPKAKSLIHEFGYPKLGAGQLYEKLRDKIIAGGGEILMECEVTQLEVNDKQIATIEYKQADGTIKTIKADAVLTSCPLTELIGKLKPDAPPPVINAASKLNYRHHICVNLIIQGKLFPDNWLYIHSRNVRMARIANYRNFSKAMACAEDINPVTVEYFCYETDDVWQMNKQQLTSLATEEMLQMGLLSSAEQVKEGFVVLSPKAYPVIDQQSQERVETLKQYLDQFDNLLPIGRTGMFKYNNQDHAIATGLLAARTVTGKGDYSPWLVNIDAEYHEEK